MQPADTWLGDKKHLHPFALGSTKKTQSSIELLTERCGCRMHQPCSGWTYCQQRHGCRRKENARLLLQWVHHVARTGEQHSAAAQAMQAGFDAAVCEVKAARARKLLPP